MKAALQMLARIMHAVNYPPFMEMLERDLRAASFVREIRLPENEQGVAHLQQIVDHARQFVSEPTQE